MAAVDAGRLPEMLVRMKRHGPEWIMESPLLFPTPVATSGETQVYGKPGARLSRKEDVAEVRTQCVLSVLIPRARPWDSRLGLEDGMALLVRPFAPHGQLASAQTRTSRAFTRFWGNWLAM